MTRNNPRHLNWHTSSYSGNSGNCVEVAELVDGTRYVRDTKNREGACLTAAAAQWASFLGGVKAGRFDC
jgi:hypothetical protein